MLDVSETDYFKLFSKFYIMTNRSIDQTKLMDRILTAVWMAATYGLKPSTSGEVYDLVIKQYKAREVDEVQILFGLEYLEQMELISSVDGGRDIGLAYRLTVKGLQIQEAGGLKKLNLINWVKNVLYIVSLLAVIAAGWYYVIEIYKFYFPK